MADTFVTEGTVLRRGDGASPEVFTAVPNITSIDPVGTQRGLIDVTNLSSSLREYKTALPDGQEINIEGQFDPGEAQHTGIRDDAQTANLVRNFEIELQTSPVLTISFGALVTNWSTGAPIDNVYPFRATLKPTGSITYSPV